MCAGCRCSPSSCPTVEFRPSNGAAGVEIGDGRSPLDDRRSRGGTMGEALDAVNRFYDAFAAGDLDAADAVFAEDCRFMMPPGPLTKAQHRMMGQAFMAALP